MRACASLCECVPRVSPRYDSERERVRDARARGNERSGRSCEPTAQLSRKRDGEDDRCRRANPLLPGIYHPAAAPVYALLGRACVSRERRMKAGGREDAGESMKAAQEREKERAREIATVPRFIRREPAGRSAAG